MKVPRKELVWFFDPVSPYSYLFLHGLHKIRAKFGSLKVVTVPVLFAGLLNAHGQKGPAEISSKRDYIFVDCLRSAHMLHIPFKMPPAHPFNPLLALRCLVCIENDEDRFAMSKEILRLCWGHGKDLTKHETLMIAAKKCRLDGHELFKLAADKPAKEKLRQNTDNAIKLGVFGVPTAIVDNDGMFWGSDRIEQLDWYLEGKFDDLDTTVLRNELSSLPRGSDRKKYREERNV